MTGAGPTHRAAQRAQSTALPLVEPLAQLSAEEVFSRLASRPHCLFLDSAQRDPLLGRYSFVTADPFDYLEVAADGSDALAELARRIEPYQAPTVAAMPPFQGGAAGMFGYELSRSLERLPRAGRDEFQVPALAVGLYDVVAVFDHLSGQSWLVSQGFPERDEPARRRRATERQKEFRRWIDEPIVAAPIADGHLVTASELAPQFVVAGPTGLTSNFSRAGYLRAIEQAIEYIRAGDIFQVNLAQRLLLPASGSAVDLYRRLRARNPAPFAGYFDSGRFQIASASPERFLHVRGREVETRPIKGTRQRIARPEADLFAGDELEQSEKDRAENVMIVDLLRNDLSRVCRPDSVRVTQLCRRENYAFVQHLVSAVRGELNDGLSPIDLVRATFPGGSITGAPKVRAMELIAELEPTARGAYCGALGYLGFDGTLDTNLLIRTITAGGGWWQAQVGGGIVAPSVSEHEYAETWHKAEGMLRALR